jgi:hypothetical protein
MTTHDTEQPLIFDMRRFTVRPIKGRWVTECRTCGELRGSTNPRAIIRFHTTHNCVTAAEAMSQRAARAKARADRRAADAQLLRATATAMLARMEPDDPATIAARREAAVAEAYQIPAADHGRDGRHEPCPKVSGASRARRLAPADEDERNTST